MCMTTDDRRSRIFASPSTPQQAKVFPLSKSTSICEGKLTFDNEPTKIDHKIREERLNEKFSDCPLVFRTSSEFSDRSAI